MKKLAALPVLGGDAKLGAYVPSAPTYKSGYANQLHGNKGHRKAHRRHHGGNSNHGGGNSNHASSSSYGVGAMGGGVGGVGTAVVVPPLSLGGGGAKAALPSLGGKDRWAQVTLKPSKAPEGGSQTTRTKPSASSSSTAQHQHRQPNTARVSSKAAPAQQLQSRALADGAASTWPMTPAQVFKAHAAALSDYEHGEILEHKKVWYIGAGDKKVRRHGVGANHGYDDDRGDYKICLHDHLAYRYEVLDTLGKGSFGQVVQVFDYKENALLAVKIIRNKKRFHHQALVEVKILEHLSKRDTEGTSNIIHIQDYFYFRNHLCICFELLSINLYEFIKNNNFQGVSLRLVRGFAVQILMSLRFMRQERIIHCDLKVRGAGAGRGRGTRARGAGTGRGRRGWWRVRGGARRWTVGLKHTCLMSGCC